MTINTADILNNPLAIQKAILTDYEARLDGEVSIVDANNTFAFLIEAVSKISTDAVNAVDAKLNGLYPIRANTTKDLFNHLSDFDYIGFFSYPASLKMSMTLHRDYLVKNAIPVPDANYQLVVIPVDTIFTVGRFKLGLYYPIHIKINTLISTISASYDTTEVNPLKSLASNSIEVRPNTFQGIDMVTFDFDTFQFDKVIYTESINPNIGFIKKYTYNDKFYAIRVFDITNGVKNELNYTMSDSVYDPNKPTVNLKIYPETNELSVAVPHIYFTNGSIGTKLQLELFTTLGEIDVSLSNLQLSDISANFAMNSPNTDLTYTNILKNIPTANIAPVNSRIVGGSNSYTFKEMKDYTIYHNNMLSVPITRLDLDRFFSKNGFRYMIKIDNLTNRRYYAYKKLFTGERELGVTSGGLTILSNEETSNQGILYQNNDTIVILPTVIYKFIPEINKFEILDDNNSTTLKNASGQQLAGILNNSKYFANPHHVVITTLDRYPACEFYDLLTTKVINTTFLEENIYLSAQLSLISVEIKHIGNGAGGYKIRAGIQRSNDLTNTSPEDLNCFLTVTTREGYRVGTKGNYIGLYNEIDVFDFTISTNYKIRGTEITTTNLIADDVIAREYEIDLTGTMYLATFVRKSAFPTVAQDDTIINYLTDNDNTWLGVSLQSFEYTLGSNLGDVLDSNLVSNWTPLQYQLYETNIPLTYEHNIYETNEDGTLKYTIDPNTNKIVTNILHNQGDTVIVEGIIMYRHKVGDVVKDAGGNPISVATRIRDFTLDLSAYEYSHFVVENEFSLSVSKDLASYYDTIRTMGDSVLENTDVFFRPIVTTNNGRYRVNNSTIIESTLELTFEFNCYVSQATLDDETMINVITEKIITIVSSHLNDEIISLTEIASDIRTTLGTYINSMDSISLNGETNIQTLMNIDIDKAPKLGTTLVVGRDGRLTYIPDVKINFKALDK